MASYKGIQFKNLATPDQPLIIDIEGTIGYEPWDNPADVIATKEQMLAEIKTLGSTKRDKIIVRIQGSLGGDVNHALTMHDLIKTNFKNIETEANGTIASAAMVLFAAGSVRRQSDNSLVLIHRASSCVWGNINDVKALADDLVKYDDRIINIFVKATGKPIEEITALMDENNGNGKWLSPEESKTAGLTTEIFEPTYNIAASKSRPTNDVITRLGLPPLPVADSQDQDLDKGQKRTIIKMTKKMIDHAFKKNSPANPNPTNMLKQFSNVNKALGVENLESTDGKGVFLNEKQLEQIHNAIQTANDATATALADKTTIENAAKADKAAAATEVKNANDAKTAAEASLTTAQAELDEVDPTVKEAKTITDKLTAVKAFVAKKPGISAPGVQGKNDTPPEGADDNKVLNELPHQKEAAAMFGF